MSIIRLAFAFLTAGALLPAQAATVSVIATQSGGFGETAAANLPSMQNYFVGYASISGAGGKARTEERRSFFVFDIPVLAGPITSATLTLELSEFGLARGLGPGAFPGVCAGFPSVEECKKGIEDPVEEFALGVTDMPSGLVLDPGLSPAMIKSVWEGLVATPAAAPVLFEKGKTPPPGSKPGFFSVEIPLTAAGLLGIETHVGGSLVFTGWMPTWSYDERKVPGDIFFEGSEAIFMFSDVLSAKFAPPTLEIVYAPIPEPIAAALLMSGLVVLAGAMVINRRSLAS